MNSGWGGQRGASPRLVFRCCTHTRRLPAWYFGPQQGGAQSCLRSSPNFSTNISCPPSYILHSAICCEACGIGSDQQAAASSKLVLVFSIFQPVIRQSALIPPSTTRSPSCRIITGPLRKARSLTRKTARQRGTGCTAPFCDRELKQDIIIIRVCFILTPENPSPSYTNQIVWVVRSPLFPNLVKPSLLP